MFQSIPVQPTVGNPCLYTFWNFALASDCVGLGNGPPRIIERELAGRHIDHTHNHT